MPLHFRWLRFADIAASLRFALLCFYKPTARPATSKTWRPGRGLAIVSATTWFSVGRVHTLLFSPGRHAAAHCMGSDVGSP